MKNYIRIIVFCSPLLSSAGSIAQFTNKGAQITIKSGAILYSKQGFQNSVGGIVTNNGSIVSDSFITNNTGCTFAGNGIYKLQGNWKNSGTYTAGKSRLIFFGKGNSDITSGGASVYDLELSKNSNGILNMLDALKLLDTIQFSSSKNWVQLNKTTLTLDSNCKITGYDETKYFITNDSGFLKKINVGNKRFTFPVGFNKSTYNPLSITESGSADNYSVRCLQHALLNGGTGNAITHGGIDVSWLVKEGVAGGMNAILEAQWYPANGDQLTGFDSSKCMVVRYTGTAWDYNAATAGLASGTTVRTRKRTGVTAVGYFTVLSTANPTLQEIVNAVNSENISAVNISDARISVYPTIVKNSINVSVIQTHHDIETMNMTLADASGKTVLQKQKMSFQSQQLWLPNLTPGIYFILIEYGPNTYKQKIIVSE
jgi:Secretion system C-terminal sorting domain